MIEDIKKLKKFKKTFNLSNEKIARKLKVSSKTVDRWINGRCDPSPVYLEKVRKYNSELMREVKEIAYKMS